MPTIPDRVRAFLAFWWKDSLGYWTRIISSTLAAVITFILTFRLCAIRFETDNWWALLIAGSLSAALLIVLYYMYGVYRRWLKDPNRPTEQ